jgi:hypothetical protein
VRALSFARAEPSLDGVPRHRPASSRRGNRVNVGLGAAGRRDPQRHEQRVEHVVGPPQGLDAHLLLDPRIALFDRRDHAPAELATARGDGDTDAALVIGHSLPVDQAGLFHAHEHADDARAGYLAQIAQLARLQRPERQQRPQDPPLLLGHPVLVQDGTELRHQRFARLQHQLGQIAVTQRGQHAAPPEIVDRI